MYWDRDDRTLWIGHSSIGIRSPITVQFRQLKLALGITCPRHRKIWQQKLGWFGRWLPDLEWQEHDGDWRLVNVRRSSR